MLNTTVAATVLLVDWASCMSIFPQDGVDMYTCDCDSGFMGTYCEKDIDECEMGTARCTNGATCIVSFCVHTY